MNYPNPSRYAHVWIVTKATLDKARLMGYFWFLEFLLSTELNELFSIPQTTVRVLFRTLEWYFFQHMLCTETIVSLFATLFV